MTIIHGNTIPEIVQLIEIKRSQQKKIVLHPNGFLQLSLHEQNYPNSEGLRLHLWPEESLPRQNPDFRVHDHVFDFESYVLFGELENHLYTVKEDENGEYLLFVPPRRLKADISNTLVNTEIRVQSHLKNIEYIRAGEIYRVAKGRFHTTLAHTFPTATIVKITNADDAVPRIVAPRLYRSEDLTFDRLGFDQEKAWRMISQIEETIRKEYRY